jgi:mRNA interferase RelE/StbE
MIVRIEKSFEKDFKKIRNKSIEKRVALCIENVIAAKNISAIKNIKALKGSDTHLRIRIGDYRIGVIEDKKEVLFIRILHRKEIYRYFP